MATQRCVVSSLTISDFDYSTVSSLGDLKIGSMRCFLRARSFSLRMLETTHRVVCFVTENILGHLNWNVGSTKGVHRFRVTSTEGLMCVTQMLKTLSEVKGFLLLKRMDFQVSLRTCMTPPFRSRKLGRSCVSIGLLPWRSEKLIAHVACTASMSGPTLKTGVSGAGVVAVTSWLTEPEVRLF